MRFQCSSLYPWCRHGGNGGPLSQSCRKAELNPAFRETLNTTDRAVELLHEEAQLAPELAPNADERQLSNILCFRALEDGLHQRILVLHHETSKRRM